LVALVILAVVLGASVIAGRTLANQAQVSADQTQMAALADESIANVRLLQQVYEASASPLDFGSATFNLAEASSGHSVKGAFYVDVTGTNPSGSTLQNGGAAILKWCQFDDLSCAQKFSPVGTANTSTLNSLYRDADVGGELIAVRRSDTPVTYDACSSSAQANRQVVDLSNPVQQTLSLTKPCFLATSANARDWDFYVRTIVITRQANTTALTNDTYQVVVTVQNYLHPGSTLVRKALVTDASPSKLITN
jgi:hypothetical protein